METQNTLTLASASPRRREILSMAGFSFSVLVADCEERNDIESPSLLVRENSKIKASAAFAAAGGTVLAADTVVALSGQILGKPKNPDDAVRMLSMLSGKTHSVFTGFTVQSARGTVTDCVETKVTMRDIRPEEIEKYVSSGSPLDKAGAYGIQDAGGMFVSGISGDWYSVMGLPLCKASEVLRTFGVTPEIC